MKKNDAVHGRNDMAKQPLDGVKLSPDNFSITILLSKTKSKSPTHLEPIHK